MKQGRTRKLKVRTTDLYLHMPNIKILNITGEEKLNVDDQTASRLQRLGFPVQGAGVAAPSAPVLGRPLRPPPIISDDQPFLSLTDAIRRREHEHATRHVPELLTEQDLLVALGLPQVSGVDMRSGAAGPPSYLTTTAVGVGLGEKVFIHGRSAFRVGSTSFFVTGDPKAIPYYRKSTSVLFVVKRDEPTKMYRLDFDTIKTGPDAGTVDWEHNQKGVAKILALTVANHEPAGSWGKLAGRTITVFKWAGTALFVAGAALSLVDIYMAQNRQREFAAQAGGWAAGWVGAEIGANAGASGGAALGALVDGIGALPGAVVGAVTGAVGGAIGGFWAGHAAVTTVWDWFCTPLEKEEFEVVAPPDSMDSLAG
jgi:hypothetical protein